MSPEELVKHHTEGVDVGGKGGRSTRLDLGCDVCGCADLLSGEGARYCVGCLDQTGKPPVHDSHPTHRMPGQPL